MFRYRDHRGGLKESLETTQEFLDLPSLAEYLGVEQERIACEYVNYDERCDWDTWIVTVDGRAVGMCDVDLA